MLQPAHTPLLGSLVTQLLRTDNPAAVSELLDRLEAAEKELESWKGLAQQFGNEADELRAAVRHEADCVDAAKAEIEALRAKVDAMEKQEPVGEIQRANSTGNYICSEVWVPLPVGSKLYALPGAQGDGK